MTNQEDSSVLTLTLTDDGGRSGRAFVQARAFSMHSVRDVTLAVREAFRQNFEDEDDTERLGLIQSALGSEVEVLPVELYPTESAPSRWEAFFRLRIEPNSSPESISACMLFPMAVVQERLERPPHWFTESSILQVVEDAGSDIEVAAALQIWIKRMWPDISPPNLQVERWPKIRTHRSISSLPRVPTLGARAGLPNLERGTLPPELHPKVVDFLKASEALDRAG